MIAFGRMAATMKRVISTTAITMNSEAFVKETSSPKSFSGMIVLTANCSSGFSDTSVYPVSFRPCQAVLFCVRLAGGPDHVVDPRRRAKQEKHQQEPGSGAEPAI